jgi:hypothetical protein
MGAIETIGSVMLAHSRDDVGVFDGDFVLALLHRLPEFVIDDAQFRDLGSDPLLRGITIRRETCLPVVSGRMTVTDGNRLTRSPLSLTNRTCAQLKWNQPAGVVHASFA